MRRTWLVVGSFVLLGAAAVAQPRAAGGQRPTGNRQDGMRMPGMRMMNRSLTLSQVPPSTLKAVLGLTAAQEQKIEGVRNKTMQTIRSLMPQSGPGQRPDPKAFEASRPKMEAAFKKADSDILAVLTPAQRKQVPQMLKVMEALRNSGLPMGVAATIKLTPAQIAKLQAIGKERSAATAKLFQGNEDPRAAMQKMGSIRDAAHAKAMSVLNAQQKALVQKWEKEHPRRAMGGPGGPGGPPTGGPGRSSAGAPGRPRR